VGGIWRRKRELPKPGSYNKPEWLWYLWGQKPPGPVEEEEEEEEDEEKEQKKKKKKANEKYI
jgi:hypothetical protein